MRSVFAVHRSSALFASISEDPRLLSLAQNILGDDVYIHQSRLNYKPAFHGREFFWHSDFETWHAEDGMPQDARRERLGFSHGVFFDQRSADVDSGFPSHVRFVCRGDAS